MKLSLIAILLSLFAGDSHALIEPQAALTDMFKFSSNFTAPKFGDKLKAALGSFTDDERDTGIEGRSFSSVDVNDDRIRIKSDSRVKVGKQKSFSRVDVEFSTKSNLPRFFYRYLAKESQTTANFASRIAFLRLVEFNDTITLGASSRVLNFRGDSSNSGSGSGIGRSWSKFTDQKGNKKFAYQNGTIQTAQTSLVFENDIQWGNLNVTVKAFIADMPATNFSDPDSGTNNVALNPNAIKWSVLIKDFPYKYENSKVALIIGFFERDNSISMDSQAAAIVNIGSSGGVFSWNTSVVADGQLKPIQVSSLYTNSTDSAAYADIVVTSGDGSSAESKYLSSETSKNGTFVAFVFPKADSLIWDPEVAYYGSASATSDASSSVASSSMLMAGLTLIFALIH
ncbi:hypothetical protein MIR68_005898 [Amoeboaphelidium protococcarum]|nr:hypothetical protein MIR68_005898 [Amoeboaphelidium protococcarum]